MNTCFLCSNLQIECTGNLLYGRKLGQKAIEKLKSISRIRKDVVYDLLVKEAEVWVTNACYKRYPDERNSFVNKDLPNEQQQVSNTTRSKRPYNYKTHCLICEGELDFESADKNPNISAYQISEIRFIDLKHGVLY